YLRLEARFGGGALAHNRARKAPGGKHARHHSDHHDSSHQLLDHDVAPVPLSLWPTATDLSKAQTEPFRGSGISRKGEGWKASGVNFVGRLATRREQGTGHLDIAVDARRVCRRRGAWRPKLVDASHSDGTKYIAASLNDKAATVPRLAFGEPTWGA